MILLPYSYLRLRAILTLVNKGVNMEQTVQTVNRSIDYQMLKAQTVVKNAKLEDIALEMSLLGYPEAELTKADSLLTLAQDSILIREKEFGEQIGATKSLDEKHYACNKRYMRHVKLLRIVLEDNKEAFKTLGLSGRRKKTISGWAGQARLLYGNLLNSGKLLPEAEAINIVQDTIVAELGAVQEVESLYRDQQKEMGEAEKATIARDEALDTLFDWTGRYVKIARVVFEDSPQTLEKLGITVKN